MRANNIEYLCNIITSTLPITDSSEIVTNTSFHRKSQNKFSNFVINKRRLTSSRCLDIYVQLSTDKFRIGELVFCLQSYSFYILLCDQKLTFLFASEPVILFSQIMVIIIFKKSSYISYLGFI